MVVRAHPPSVERVLAAARALADGHEPDPVALTAVVRVVVEAERRRLAAGADDATIERATPERLAEQALDRLSGFSSAGIPAVINATGVIVHTNLGRAPWPASVATATAAMATDYLLLE